MDRRTRRINGILDFGAAGLGDPARDYAILLHVYGETLVRRMAGWNSQDQDWIDRARFYSGTFELQWVLAGVRTKSFDWFTAHLDRARCAALWGIARVEMTRYAVFNPRYCANGSKSRSECSNVTPFSMQYVAIKQSMVLRPVIPFFRKVRKLTPL